MILGYASFGHKGVIFPLLVRAIGVVGSIISTYSVKAGANSTSDEALHSVHRGFILGSIISVVGFFVLGLGYLHFDDNYITEYPQATGRLPPDPRVQQARAAFDAGTRRCTRPSTPTEGEGRQGIWRKYRDDYASRQEFVATTRSRSSSASQPIWSNFGWGGLDMRPAWTCLIGIILAIALNKCTSYYTHTQYEPVKSLAKACQTGHATNIIQGFAVGYESTVVAGPDHRGGDPPLGLDLRRGQPDLRRLRRGDVRHRHAHADRQHDQHGRLRPGRRQLQRHRRDGLRPRGDGRGELQARPPDPGRPRRRRQHHQGRDQGDRHRLGGDRRGEPLRQLHRGDRRRQRVEDRRDDHRAIPGRGGQALGGPARGLHRHADRRRGAVPVQLDADPRRRPRGVPDRQGVPRSSSATRRSGPAPRPPTTAAWSTSAPPRRRAS